MSRDQMQDVFPISFNYVMGEQPTATKLTGHVKQTDTAFSNITQAIGDPWEYQAHTAGSSSYFLSPARLTQTSLARFSGPSDYVSPRGASFQESVNSTLVVTLLGGRNTWCLGFPLVKLSSDLGLTDTGSTIQKLVWNTDITTTSSYLTTEKSTPQELSAVGDFYVDYYRGIITIYGYIPSNIFLNISNIHMFGPGASWATSNVIPHWSQTTSLVSATKISTIGGYTSYTLSFPQVDRSSRSSGSTYLFGGTKGLGATADSMWLAVVSGATASYRLPYSLTANLSAGDEVPEGFCRLWDENAGRLISASLTVFYYIDATSIKVTTTEDYLTEGENYRLITIGSSLAESTHFNTTMSRENRHTGLDVGQHADTLFYTQPISHDDMADLYAGSTFSYQAEPTRFYFRKSSYPTNPHPQYLHRAGYLSNDSGGNTGNAMRGDIVFSSVNFTDPDTGLGSGYVIGSGNSSGCMYRTNGLLFGGDRGSTSSARISYEGGGSISDWTSGVAHRLAFGLYEVGANPTTMAERYGALTHTPWYGAPFYLRGASSSSSYAGAVLGFDLGQNSELNYIKLLPGYRSSSGNYVNIPANTGQTNWSTPLGMTPSLSNRLSEDQIREFRFRGVPYVSNATNTSSSIGGINSISEFQYHFTSPGMVGADFFNVYSNAIFFSSQGDGRRTSFTEDGETWLSGSGTAPVGLYYRPQYQSSGGAFEFVIRDSTNTARIPFLFSYDTSTYFNCHDFTITGSGDMLIQMTSDFSLYATSDIYLSGTESTYVNSGSITLNSSSGYGNVLVYASEGIDLSVGSTLSTSIANDKIYIRTKAVPFALSTDDIGIFSDSNLYLNGDNNVVLRSSSNGLTTVNYSDLVAATASVTLTSASVGNSYSTVSTTPTNIVLTAVDLSPSATTTLTVTPNHIWFSAPSASQNYYFGNVQTGGGTDPLYLTVGGFLVKTSSSTKYKKDINNLNSIDWLYKLNPVSFVYKNDDDKHKYYGFIAEDVAKINSELVSFRDGEPDNVLYNSIIPASVKALQMHKNIIKHLEEKISNLEKELERKADKKISTKRKK